MRKEDVIAFVERDWDSVAELKRQWWASEKRRMTPAEALSVGDELRYHASTVREDWPTIEERRQDRATHIRVSEMLRRVEPAHRR